MVLDQRLLKPYEKHKRITMLTVNNQYFKSDFGWILF